MRVGIATDDGGFALKEDLTIRLQSAGLEVMDFGAPTLVSTDDYPDFVIPLARAVTAGQVERGIAVCGSVVGASLCANKIPGIRAGLIAAGQLDQWSRGTWWRHSSHRNSAMATATFAGWAK